MKTKPQPAETNGVSHQPNPWQAHDPSRVDKPKPAPLETTSKVLQAIAWVVLILGSSYAVATYTALPNEVPLHFNAIGEPDAWGNKNESLIPLIVLFVSAVLCLVLARFPKSHNVPLAMTTETGWQKSYTATTNLLLWCGMGVALVIPEIAHSTKNPDALPLGYLLPLAVMLLPMFYYIPRLIHLAQKDRETATLKV